MNSGSDVARSPPVIGSGCVVSPVATSTHPRSSTALVKKSPKRRSSPVATHVVPFWQMLLSAIGRPTTSVVCAFGAVDDAPVIVDSMTLSFAFWQARSTTLSVWYQTTLTLPASPATAHGQNARALAGEATARGADHVWPKSFEYDIRTLLAAGVSAPSQPPLVPAWRGSVSHTRKSSPALS